MKMLAENDVDVSDPLLQQWISASCRMGIHPADISFFYVRHLAWSALCKLLLDKHPAFASLSSDKRSKLCAEFFGGADEHYISTEFAKMQEETSPQSVRQRQRP